MGKRPCLTPLEMTQLHEEPATRRAPDAGRPAEPRESRSDRFAFYYYMASIVAGVLMMLVLLFSM